MSQSHRSSRPSRHSLAVKSRSPVPLQTSNQRDSDEPEFATVQIVEKATLVLPGLSAKDALTVWKALGLYLEEQLMSKRRTIRVDPLGVFGVNDAQEAVFHHLPTFLKANRLRELPTRGIKGQPALAATAEPMSRVNATEIGQEFLQNCSKEVVSAVVTNVIALAAKYAKQERSLRLSILPVGEWICRAGTAEFQFLSDFQRRMTAAKVVSKMEKAPPPPDQQLRSSKVKPTKQPGSQKNQVRSAELTSESLFRHTRASNSPSARDITASSPDKPQPKASRPKTSFSAALAHKPQQSSSQGHQRPSRDQDNNAKRSSVASLHPTVARVRAKLLSRCGENGLNALHRVLALLDTSGDGVLSAQELKFGLRDLGVELTPSELSAVMKYLDKDQDGHVTLTELLEALRGEDSLPPHRRALVLRAFRLMDPQRRGVVTLDDLRENYDVSQLPRVRAGSVSKAQALREFLREWEEVGVRSGETGVSEDAFVTFYQNVSATVEDDGDFERLMRTTWHVGPEEPGDYAAKATSERAGTKTNDNVKAVTIAGNEVKRSNSSSTATAAGAAARGAATAAVDDEWTYLRSILCRPRAAWSDAEPSAAPQRPIVPTLDDLCRRLGANRVWGDGNETMNTRAFANALCSLDRRLQSKDALRHAETVRAACCECSGGDVISLQQLHRRLARSDSDCAETATSNDPSGTSSSTPAIIERIRTRLCQRLAQSESSSGGQTTGSASSAGVFLGLNSLQRTLRIMDSNGDRRLSKDELRIGLQKIGVSVTFHELDQLFSVLDADRSGCVDSDEFLVAMRGDMNARRLALVHTAFDRLDRDRDGTVTLAELRRAFDVSRHPEVQSGRLSANDALRLFAQQWDVKDRDGVISRDEFELYYRNVSASIDRDDYFELMMRNAWHISGGDGACANSSNRRVLVTDVDGAQRVVEVKDDLGIRADDHARIRATLQAQDSTLQPASTIETYGAKLEHQSKRRDVKALDSGSPSWQRMEGMQGHQNAVNRDSRPKTATPVTAARAASTPYFGREDAEQTKQRRAEERQRERERRENAALLVQSVFRGFKSRKWAALVRRQIASEAAKRQRETQQQQLSVQRRILRAPLKAHYGF
ncbi:hypothetical protein PINS_up013377 [Pythium insidiosum]|nr:hypothetical protein PINS_up013377 [Pythium insidiosum]